MKKTFWQTLKQGFAGNTAKVAATASFIVALEELFDELSREFNAAIAHEPLMLAVRKPADVLDATDGAKKTGEYERLIVTTSFWSLSIRANSGIVEFFLLPACELPNLAEAELPSRSKLRLTYEEQSTQWCMDELPVSENELSTLVRSLLKDLIARSQGDYDLLPESMRLVYGGLSLTRSVRSLVADRHALVQKIVNQQESILAQVGRDLHDAVLGNIMLLIRSLDSDKEPSKEEMESLLSEIATNLQNICHDVYPRDLKDLGLTPLVHEMCSSFSMKTGVETKFVSTETIPDLTDEVLLHIYRIAQECFNNIGKHASATLVEVALSVEHGVFTMSIKDNGTGFDLDSVSTRGSGTSIIRERSELINCIYPCKIGVATAQNEGTKVVLEILFASEV